MSLLNIVDKYNTEMKIEVANDNITVEDPSDEVMNFITSQLVYTDKAKQYQLRRMSKNLWQRNSPLYKKLQLEVEGRLYSVNGTGSTTSYTFSSCFLEMMKTTVAGLTFTDKRSETGKKLVLPWIVKPFDLRDYQEEACNLMMNNYRGIVNFATGLGKTLVAVHMVKRCHKRALIVCPSESVASQFYDQFVSCFGKNKVGFFGDGKKEIKDITVGIAMSISKHISKFKDHELGLVIVDEVHHVPATTFYNIASGIANVGKVFGLTATDFRSDGKDIMITGGCGSVMIRRDIKWGVKHGWLAEPYFIVKSVNTVGKDYSDKLKCYKEHVLNNALMRQQIEDDCRKMMAAGKSILCLVDEVEHGKQLAANLGIPFATGVDKRSSEYVEQLNKGEISGLIGTDSKVGEGTDTKNVDVLILANFVASKGPVIQAIGRGLRKQGSKTKCIILDYIPKGSEMLTRHAWSRIKFFREITDKVKLC